MLASSGLPAGTHVVYYHSYIVVISQISSIQTPVASSLTETNFKIIFNYSL